MPAAGLSGRTYKIGEAAKQLQLKTCVLRFWEEEFPQLAPERTEKGQRLYSSADMTLLRRIRSLLHEQGMTIDGARRVLEGSAKVPGKVAGKTAGPSKALVPAPVAHAHDPALLPSVLAELEIVRALLAGGSA